jgi:hypothetical protein
MDSSFQQRFLSLCTLAACEKACLRSRRDGRACHRTSQSVTCTRRDMRKPISARRPSA